MIEIKAIKLAGFALVVVCAVGVIVYRKVQTRQAEKLTESGDLEAALLAYKKLFVDEVETHINSDGSGNVKFFLRSLENNGRSYLGEIALILEQKGMRMNTTAYDTLVSQVRSFSEQSGVMNYKKEPVKDGKIQFAAFYRELTSFTLSIPENV